MHTKPKMCPVCELRRKQSSRRDRAQMGCEMTVDIVHVLSHCIREYWPQMQCGGRMLTITNKTYCKQDETNYASLAIIQCSLTQAFLIKIYASGFTGIACARPPRHNTKRPARKKILFGLWHCSHSLTFRSHISQKHFRHKFEIVRLRFT